MNDKQKPTEKQRNDDPVRNVKGAQDAVTDMVAEERRRDQEYRTGGDDTSNQIDEGIDNNAPKYSEERRS